MGAYDALYSADLEDLMKPMVEEQTQRHTDILGFHKYITQDFGNFWGKYSGS